jgi:cytochrome P450
MSETRAFPFSDAAGLVLDPTFAFLRNHEPISRIALPYGGEGWLLVRYADVRAVATDRRFSRAAAVGPQTPRLTVQPPGGSALTLMDAPGHTRLRKLLSAAFTARRVTELKPRIGQITSELLADLNSPTDLMADFALPLPVRVICELMGVPYADRDRFSGLATMLLSSTAHSQAEVSQAVDELSEYLADLIDARRARPADDLIGALIRARDADDQLSEQELLTMCGTILAAGYENVANAIGNFTLLLLTERHLFDRLHAAPELLPDAIEELLRYVVSGLAVSHPRIATEDVELGGVLIGKGEAVFTSMPAANHDPAVFSDPDRIDFARTDNKHLAFGYGMHHCIGAALARLELQVALGALISGFPTLKLEPDAVRWKLGFTVRGPSRLLVSW